MGVGFIAKMVTIIVKSAVNSKVGSELGKELIGTSIDGVSERSITEINNFISGKKSKLERILSEENMKKIYVAEENIDFVIAELKDLLSEVEITDDLFRECRYNPENLKDILWNEYRRDKDIIENESDIEKGLDDVAKTLIGLVRESEEFEKELLIQISNSVDDANVELQKISDYMQKNYGKLDDGIQMILVIVRMILEQIQYKDSREGNVIHEKKFKNNKKQDYIDNWNSRLFLHLDNNENPITLADAFIMPDFDYIIKSARLNLSDNDTLGEIIDKFIIFNRSINMLILGEPGIGKSSVTSWIANRYNFNDNLIILRFRDWERMELNRHLLEAICATLKCSKNDLEGKTLVLDGFDEIKSKNDLLLNDFFNQILDFRNLKLIFTSRLGYIDKAFFQNVFILLPFNISKIEKFYYLITKDECDIGKEGIENLDIVGIPVILYMAIMSGINITENNTRPELYTRIFAEKGGIFDRFCFEGVGYDIGSQPLRDKQNIERYFDFLQKISFRMFEEDTLLLSRNDCQIPKLNFQGESISVLEFPIKNLFESTDANIEFIHKSIYEYFVSEYIFWSIYEMIGTNVSKEKLAGILGKLLKSDELSKEILDFLKYRLINILSNKFSIIYDTFHLMLQDGMTYYTGERYKNVIECEMNVFANMLEILHLWEDECIILDDLIVKYIQCNSRLELNLSRVILDNIDFTRADVSKVNLNNADLTGVTLSVANLDNVNMEGAILYNVDFFRANLAEADLSGADLEGVRLTDADLRDANLEGANLRDANLEGANLNNINLNGTILTSTIFDERQVEYLERRYNLQGAQVVINNTMEVVSYAEYYNRRKQIE